MFFQDVSIKVFKSGILVPQEKGPEDFSYIHTYAEFLTH